jgi:hypothetical protein
MDCSERALNRRIAVISSRSHFGSNCFISFTPASATFAPFTLGKRSTALRSRAANAEHARPWRAVLPVQASPVKLVQIQLHDSNPLLELRPPQKTT